MEKEITMVIGSLLESIQVENESEAMGLLGDAIDYVKSSKYNHKDPETFDLFVNSKLRNAVGVLTKNLHEPTVCKDKHKPEFIYRNYDFLEMNVKKLCVLREGSSCSADKSRYLIRMYLDYSITGEVPADNLQKKEFWKPKFGSNKDWMDYCDGLYKLYYGKTEAYLEHYVKLVKSERVTFERACHIWFIEMLNGDTYQVTNTWDEDVENPLALDETETAYLLPNVRAIKKGNFKKYEPKEENFFTSGLVMIPKSDIKRVYKETEIKNL